MSSSSCLSMLLPPTHLVCYTPKSSRSSCCFVSPLDYCRRRHHQLLLFVPHHLHICRRGICCSTNTTSGGETTEAIEAVTDLLVGYGVSREEAGGIANKSPKYIQMLVDDLDDLNSINPDPNSVSNYKHRVYEMGLQKGDKGMAPFLESIGLGLPSALRFSRYLSSTHTLISLIHQVKHVKDIFFSRSDPETTTLIGKKARRMLMHLSVPADDDLQQTLSFLHKIQAKRGGLDLLASGDASLPYLIESFPRLLLLPVEAYLKPIVKFLEDAGIPIGCVTDILLLFPPIAFFDVDKFMKSKMQALEKVNAGDKEFGKMLLKYPWSFSVCIQDNQEAILTLFEKEKVADVYSHRAIRSWPLILGCSVGKMNLMLDQFRQLGIRDKKLGQIIATSPQLLLRKPQDFWQSVSFLKELGLDEETVGKVLGRCPEIFTSNIERTLKMKLQFLLDIGVSSTHLPRVIRKYPELFVCDINKAFIPRVEYLLKMGLSKRDVASMVGRFSPLLGYSVEEVLKPKAEFLLNSMQKPLAEVVDYPRYFSYSLEKRIKPRYWVIKSRNFECSLKDMLAKNDDEFADEYMLVGWMPNEQGC